MVAIFQEKQTNFSPFKLRLHKSYKKFVRQREAIYLYPVCIFELDHLRQTLPKLAASRPQKNNRYVTEEIIHNNKEKPLKLMSFVEKILVISQSLCSSSVG